MIHLRNPGRKVTPSQIRSTYDTRKQTIDREFHYWAYIAIRPLSFYVTVPFIRLGLSATAVTLLGALILFLGLLAIAISSNSFGLLVAGVVLVNIWYLFDFVDGNIARYNKEASKFGGFLDSLIGHFYHTLLPVCVGFALLNYEHGFMDLHEYALYIGLGMAFLTASRSAISSKSKLEINDFGEPPADNQGNYSNKISLSMIAHAILSFQAPLLLVAVALNLHELWLFCYFLFSIVIWGAVICFSLRSMKKEDLPKNNLT